MKKILVVLFLILLTSCKGEDTADYLLTPHELYVTLCHRDVSIDGTLEISTDGISFRPDSPDGLCITLNADGGEVRYGDTVFGGEVARLTRLMPLYTELTEGSLRVIFNEGECPEAIVGKDFKITVHKEINR